MTEEIPTNQPIQPDLPPTPPIMLEKKSNTGLIVKLLIVTLLVGVGGVYAGIQIQKGQLSLPFLKPIPTPAHVEPFPTVINPDRPTPPDETADWKNFFGEFFTFKYPPEFDLGIGMKYGEDAVLVSKDKGFSININMKERGYDCLDESAQKEEIIFNGQNMQVPIEKGSNSEICGNINDRRLVFTQEHGNDTYSFFFSYKAENENSAIKTLNQILSTFKFLP